MESLALQNTRMRGRGVGWRAERCADVDAIPVHVMVRVSSRWETIRSGVMLSALGVGGTAAVLGGMWWGRQRRFSMKTLSGSET